jgi:hypothetical protein
MHFIIKKLNINIGLNDRQHEQGTDGYHEQVEVAVA